MEVKQPILVSIIIPCYNVENCIARAINSALAQTYLHTEIICVDNNSTDRTLEILNDYRKKYPEKIQVFQEFEQGAPAARNLGMRYAKGEWLQFLDADDEILPGKLLRQVQLLFATSAGGLTGTPVYEDLAGKRVACELWENSWKGLAHGMYAGQTSANLYNYESLKGINGWDESLVDTQDTDLLTRLMMNKVILVQDRTPSCICYDRESGKLSKKDPQGILIRHVELRNRMISYLSTSESDFWTKNDVFFFLATYRFIRMLACYNPAKAQLLFDQYLNGFRIEANKSLKIPWWDALFVNMIGLKRFATIKNRLKSLFPDFLWRAMKFCLKGI